MAQSVLAGHTILVVEDEWMVASDLAGMLRAEGATAVVAGNIQEAERLARTEALSAALVDVNMRGSDCAPVCSILAERSVPFAFCTGDVDARTVKVWRNAPMLRKPVRDQDLIATITALIL